MKKISIGTRAAFLAKTIGQYLFSINANNEREIINSLYNLGPGSIKSILLVYKCIMGNNAHDKFNIFSLKRLLAELEINESISMEEIATELEQCKNDFSQFKNLGVFEKDLESYCSTIKDFETEILKYKSIIFQEFYKLYKVKLLQEAEIKIFEHRETLARKKKQKSIKDDYGIVDPKGWEEEKSYFINALVLPLFKPELLTKDDVLLIDGIIENVVKNTHDASTGTYSADISPDEYEQYCATVLEKNGWEARTTQKTGDQGVDIVAKRNGLTIAVQCKHYSQPVGNKAVQEAHSGKGFYGTDIAVVITNNDFTKSAKELAASLDVLLLHHSELNEFDKHFLFRRKE